MAKKEKGLMNEDINDEVTHDSQEVVDQKKAEREAKKAERNEAKNRVREYIKSLEDGDKLKADLVLLIGTGHRAGGGGGQKSTLNKTLREFFIENGEATEMDLFLKFKVGRPDMAYRAKLFIKTPNVDDRLWIKFDEVEEKYILVGQGADVPEGWDGYLPAEQNVL